MKSKVRNKSTQLNIWANYLLVLGFSSLLIFNYLIYQRYNPKNLSFNISSVKASQKTASSSNINPIGISINSINLGLPIRSAEINNNKWGASTDSVSYLQSSATPGQKGNSILYGHNWPNLLGNLKKIKPGEKIIIIYSDNSSKAFEVEYLAEVMPSETSIIENSDDYRITLYTCTGFLDSKRLVVVAKLINS